MDFSLNESQQAVSDLAAQIFAGDRDQWTELATANLLGIALPDDVGGSGLGFIEMCLVLEQQGRRVVPLPLLPTMVGAFAINEFGTADQRDRVLPGVCAGETVLAVALDPLVAYAEQSAWMVAPSPSGDGLRLVSCADAGVRWDAVETTDGQPHAVVHL